MSKNGIIGLVGALGLIAEFANGQLQPDCNPLHTSCQPKKALSESNYYIDFTKQTGTPPDWTIADSEVVKFTSNGAEFSYAKQGDAPNMWTDFYLLGGRYDVEMKIAPGQGVISNAVLWSDTQDEIDYEFSGNQFGEQPFPPKDGMWAIETSIFSQGKMWDDAATYQKDAFKPTEQFHKYSVEWDETHMNWYVDDKVVRSVLAKDTPSGFAFPQSPMKLQLGVWGGGDPTNNYWTIHWAGGEIDMDGVPYTTYVKSVNITNKYPACQYNYKDKSGKADSIEKITDGCGPSTRPARLARNDAFDDSYPMSPPSAASEAQSSSVIHTSSSSSTGYATYEANSPSAHASSSSPIESPATYPVSPPSSAHSSTSSSGGYPTYDASSPVSSSLTQPAATYPAASVSSSSSSPLSKSTAESITKSTNTPASSGPNEYPTSSPTSSRGILSSLSSYLLGTSSGTTAESGSSGIKEPTYPNVFSTTGPTSASSLETKASGSSSQESSSSYPGSSSSAIKSESLSTTSDTIYSYSMSSGSPKSSETSPLDNGVSTIYSTNIYTVTSCPPSVTNCPVGKVTTELISMSTTVSSATKSSGSQGVPSSTASTGSVAAAHSSLSSNIVGSASASSSTANMSASFQVYSTSAVQSSSQTMPSTYSVSSEITTSTLSTVYSTNIVTITSCAPTVTNCPVGHVTTEMVSLYTTVCPVTHTILDGTTYSGTVAAQSIPSSSSLLTYSASSLHPTSVGSAPLSTSSSIHTVSNSSNSVGTSSSELGSSSVSGTASSVNSAETSSSLLSSGTGFQNSTVYASGSSTAPVLSYSASSIPVLNNATGATVSTVYSTNVYTITSCAPDVTNCPARLGQVTTESISLYTTIGPISKSLTIQGTSSALAVGTESSVPAQSISSYATLKNTSTYSVAMTTSTVYTSSIYTVSSCESGATECSSKIGSVTTEIVPAYTTVCPVEETATALPEGTTKSMGSVPSVGSSSHLVESSHVSPVQSYATSAPTYTTSTIYSTNIHTVTSCAPGVTNCPASGSVTTEIVAVSTTVCPVADKPTSGTSAVVGGSQYTTAAVTLSNTVSGSVIVVTSTISFVDTPAPPSYYPTQDIGTVTTAGTAAIAASSLGLYPNASRPGTTVTLGNYFTTVIEYDTIIPQAQTPASVSSGATPTSYYIASSGTADVPSYQMSEPSSTAAMPPPSASDVVSAASSQLIVAPLSSKNSPGGASYPTSSDTLTIVTSSTTNTATVYQSHGSKPSGAACDCEPLTVSVTVTQTVAQVTVTSTVEAPFPSSYPMGTAPLGTAGDAKAATQTSTTAPLRRWLRRGHGYGAGHGH